MNSKTNAWIVAGIMALLAVAGWLLDSPFVERPSTGGTAGVEQQEQSEQFIADLQRQNENLQSEYDITRTENTALRSLNEALKMQKEKNTQAFEQLSAQLQSLEQSSSQQQVEVSGHLTEISQLRKLNETLKIQVDESQKTIDDLTDRLESLSQTRTGDDSNETDSAGDLAYVRSLNQELRNNIAKSHQTIEQLTLQLDSLIQSPSAESENEPAYEDQIANLQSLNVLLLKQLEESQIIIDDLTGQISILTQVQVAQGDANKEPSSEISVLRSLNETLRKQIQDNQTIIAELTVQVTNLNGMPPQNMSSPTVDGKQGELPVQAEDLETRYAALQKAYEDAIAKSDMERLELNDQIKQLNAQIKGESGNAEPTGESESFTDLMKLLEQNRQFVTILTEENEQLVSDNRQLAQRTDDLADNNLQLERQLSSLENDLLVAGTQISQHAEAISDFEFRTNYLSTRLRYARKQLTRNRSRNRALEFRTNYLSTRLRYARKQLTHNRSRNRALEASVADLTEQNAQISSQLADATDALREMDTAVTTQIDEKVNLAVTLYEISGAREEEIRELLSRYSNIRIGSDVLFESGSAQLSANGQRTLLQVADKYHDFPERIMSIEGHTDNKPISKWLIQFYPTNWELSAARAASAARFVSKHGVPEDKIRVVGFGSLQPISSNETEKGRRENRRIEIRLSPILSEAKPN